MESAPRGKATRAYHPHGQTVYVCNNNGFHITHCGFKAGVEARFLGV